MEGDLRGLAEHPDDDEDEGDRAGGRVGRGGGPVVDDVGAGGRARPGDEHGGAEQQPDVGDPRDHEGRVGGPPRPLATRPVTDEQVGAPAHDLPADDREEQVGGEDDEHHRGAEERDGRVEGAAPVVVGEVPRGIGLHERGDEGDDEHEEGARRRQGQTEREVGAAHDEARSGCVLLGEGGAPHPRGCAGERDDGQHERAHAAGDAGEGGQRPAASDEEGEHRCGQRQHDEGPGHHSASCARSMWPRRR